MEWDNIEILLADVIQLLKNILLITYVIPGSTRNHLEEKVRLLTSSIPVMNVIPALSRNLSKNSDLYIIDI